MFLRRFHQLVSVGLTTRPHRNTRTVGQNIYSSLLTSVKDYSLLVKESFSTRTPPEERVKEELSLSSTSISLLVVKSYGSSSLLCLHTQRDPESFLFLWLSGFSSDPQKCCSFKSPLLPRFALFTN